MPYHQTYSLIIAYKWHNKETLVHNNTDFSKLKTLILVLTQNKNSLPLLQYTSPVFLYTLIHNKLPMVSTALHTARTFPCPLKHLRYPLPSLLKTPGLTDPGNPRSSPSQTKSLCIPSSSRSQSHLIWTSWPCTTPCTNQELLFYCSYIIPPKSALPPLSRITTNIPTSRQHMLASQAG